MMERMEEALLPRPAMLRAIASIRGAGLRVAALTNNWSTAAEHESPSDGTDALREHFDVFIESSVEALRKPDPRIYELVCARLAVAPAEAVFLDDIGSNLKSARRLGMTTIKVVEPKTALAELEGVLGLSLLG
jgi:epoxide hydrolase-like predicted phosphatase